MKNVLVILLAVLPLVTFAQAWHDVSGWTSDAKIALNRVYGEPNGFSPEKTLKVVDSIYTHGSFQNKVVLNSGVGAGGVIKPLKADTFLVTFLGNIPASLLGRAPGDGYTCNLYLKGDDCRNLCWTLVEPAPPSAPVEKNVFQQNPVVVEDYKPQPSYDHHVRGGDGHQSSPAPQVKPEENTSVVPGATVNNYFYGTQPVPVVEDEQPEKIAIVDDHSSDEYIVSGAWFDPRTKKCFCHNRKYIKCGLYYPRYCRLQLALAYNSRSGLSIGVGFGGNVFNGGYCPPLNYAPQNNYNPCNTPGYQTGCTVQYNQCLETRPVFYDNRGILQYAGGPAYSSGGYRLKYGG